MANVESAADRAELLDSGDFGEVVQWKGDLISAVWYQEYFEDQETEGSSPAILVRTADVSGADHGDEVKRTVAGVTTDYTVRGVQADGTGMTKMILELQ